MMITHLALNYKNRILQTFLIIALGLFCYAFARNISIIPDDVTPLSSGNVEAMFYIENEETGSLTCIGDGLIKQPSNISNSEPVNSVIITSPDYSNYISSNYQIEWRSIKYDNGHYNVIGCTSKRNEVNNDYTFATFNDINTDLLYNGCIVSTNGYSSVNDGGNATYLITNKPSYPIDDIFVIKLNSNLYAQMQFSSSSIINVACAGIMPNENISANLNKFIKTCVDKVAGIRFNSGIYYIDSSISLEQLDYYGSDNTVLSISPNYNTYSYGIITNSTNCSVLNIDNITFDYTTSNNHLLANKSSVLLALNDITESNISNCRFYANNQSANTTSITLLWFRHCNFVNNVSITNTAFENNTGELLDNNTLLRGGCLWFNGNLDSNANHLSNIKIDNCSFKQTTSDEAIGFWHGLFNNITISNSSISSIDHKTNNLISFFDGKFNAINLHDNTFNTSSDARIVIKAENLWQQSDFDISKCTFLLNAINSEPYKSTQSVFLINNDQYGSTINFKNNTLSSSNNTMYLALLNCESNKSTIIVIRDNNISCPLLYGFVYISNSTNINAITTDNMIENNSFVSTTYNCDNCSLSVENSEIIDGKTFLAKPNSNLTCTLSNNNYSVNDKESIIKYNNSEAKLTSNIVINNN